MEIRSQVKGYRRYGLKIFSEGVNCSKDRYTKFRDDRAIRSRVILGKPEGVASTPPPPPPCVGEGLSPKTPKKVHQNYSFYFNLV